MPSLPSCQAALFAQPFPRETYWGGEAKFIPRLTLSCQIPTLWQWTSICPWKNYTWPQVLKLQGSKGIWPRVLLNLGFGFYFSSVQSYIHLSKCLCDLGSLGSDYFLMRTHFPLFQWLGPPTYSDHLVISITKWHAWQTEDTQVLNGQLLP